MKGDILSAYAEWDDRAGAFSVYLAREGDDGHEDLDHAKPLRTFTAAIGIGGDPIEARLGWAATIHCPKDTAACSGAAFTFEREAQAKRVASRCNKELAAIRKGKPLLHGLGAQALYLAAGGTGRIMFSIDHLRGKIHGAT